MDSKSAAKAAASESLLAPKKGAAEGPTNPAPQSFFNRVQRSLVRLGGADQPCAEPPGEPARKLLITFWKKLFIP
jgi:hypothetical protein